MSFPLLSGVPRPDSESAGRRFESFGGIRCTRTRSLTMPLRHRLAAAAWARGVRSLSPTIPIASQPRTTIVRVPSSKVTPPPRLYCLPATEAPVALVFSRGPSGWFHLLRWWLDTGVIEHGVWVRKKIFPRRCDFSPDGELMLYYLSGGVQGRYRVFGGISRAPWLHPLASWDEIGTWGRGECFATDATLHGWGSPREFDLPAQSANSRSRVAIMSNDVVSFVNERRRGWIEAEDCEPRAADDTWDERRSVILWKSAPSGQQALRLVGGDYVPDAMGGRSPRFELQCPSGGRTILTEAAWADWDKRGRLLTATTSGLLRAERVEGETRTVVEEHDLNGLRPDPQPAPDWAMAAPPSRAPTNRGGS